MPRIKAVFPNRQGEQLAGLLELPEEPARAWALFAHCFTCSKDVAAASRIARALSQKGIAVLRFDFTGLGNSDGDFANTNFSSNVDDLVQAAEYLAANHGPPALLIGHSLGGAAVLAAAGQIPAARAVVTIGAPATGQHVEHLFAHARDVIASEGEAVVDLAGRQFRIRRQFLDDIDRHNDTDHIRALGKALLVLHSPVDETVSIDEAAKIYGAARHPKSFVSLDRADHLLTRREDSAYVAAIVAAWASHYLELGGADFEASSGTAPAVAPGQVRVTEVNRRFTRRIYTEHHQFFADEPRTVEGGLDQGPNPYELLLAALGACTSMTVRMYANRKQMQLEDIEVTLAHDRIHAADCADCETREGMVDRIRKVIRLAGPLDEEQRQRLLEIAEKCPVNRTLANEIHMESELA